MTSSERPRNQPTMLPRVAIEPLPTQPELNPSHWRTRVRITLLASIGFLIAMYLGLYQWRLVGSVWDPLFGEGTRHVLDSDLSHRLQSWMRIPDAVLGALAYLGDGIFAMAGSVTRWQMRPWLVLVFGLDVILLGVVSALLISLQGAVVGSWCFLCLLTAAISLVLAYMASSEIGFTLRYLWRLWLHSRNRRLVWQTFCGQASDAAYSVALDMVQRRRHVGKNR